MISEATLAYLSDLFAEEDLALRAARERHECEDLPPMHVSPDEGQLLAVLLQAVGANRVLEIGTLGGYSGVWLARAIGPDGRLVTIECDPRHAAAARRTFDEAGVAGRVELIEGDATKVLADLTPPFDAVFIDADKESLPQYFHESMRLLRPGGLLLCDNTAFHNRVVDPADTAPVVEGVRAFNRLAAENPDLTAAAIPIRDGLLLGVKRRP